jgi:uncharacterized RDD family membrane protein YckC
MDNTENSKIDEFEKNIDKIFNEELDEEFDFKPITKGLGFHHSIKDKKELTSTLKQKQIDLKDSLDQRAKQLNKPINKINTQATATSMGDLAPFYQEQKKESVSLDIEVSKEEDDHEGIANAMVESASMIIRFGAWLMDMIIINALFFISFISMMLTSRTPLTVVRELLMSVDLFITIMPIYVIFYIFYFSFFDKTSFSTPGKKLMGLKVINLQNENISMLQALMRSLITVVAAFTFGLITILDAQSRLTDTKVIRKND